MKLVPAVLAVCTLTLGFSAWQSYSIISQYRQSRDIYSEALSFTSVSTNNSSGYSLFDDIKTILSSDDADLKELETLNNNDVPGNNKNSFPDNTENDTKKTEKTRIPRSEKPETVDVAALRTASPESLGWIYWGEANISYPLMKDDGTMKYLNTAYNGRHNFAGAIFTENSGFDDRNTVIYGHNMKNGSMFGCLKYVAGRKNFSDPYIYIYTDDGILKYQVYSVHTSDGTDGTYQIPYEEQDYQSYLQMTETLSAVKYEIPEDTGKILTLSTCHGVHGSGQRLVVHAMYVGKT